MTRCAPDVSRIRERSVRVAALLAFVALGITAPGAASAQTPPSTPEFPSLQTLPMTTVPRCIYQDLVGFIWMCADGGIVRFDGREEVTFGREIKGLRAILRRRDGHY